MNITTGIAALAVFGRGHDIVVARQALFWVVALILEAVFALRANRLYWQREHNRIYSQAAPAAPTLVTKYASDQKVWLYFGFALPGFIVVASIIGIGREGLASVVQQLTYVAIQFLVLGAAYAWDRLRRRRYGHS